ncbi:MAG: class I SAM-dependent methyltransferase [Candidatus Atribacteria bacterium]
MEKEKQLPPEGVSEQKLAYLEMQAGVGITKHMGGPKATEELIKLCHIDKGKYVLDVGCGTGRTACLLTKNYGCSVVGVDITPGMVKWSKERAKEEGVEDKVEFKVAGAQKLPFEDNVFDAVICESVLAFVEEKGKVISEFVRLTKPGGYVGMNETTWLKTPLPKEIVDYFSVTEENVEILTPDAWKGLLEKFRLKEIIARSYKTSARKDAVERMQLQGIRRTIRGFYLFFKNPVYRKFLKMTKNPPKNLYDYYGYGVYVGRK